MLTVCSLLFLGRASEKRGKLDDAEKAYRAATLAKPDDVWFTISQQAGGLFVLGLAGVVLLAASMGHTDGNVQAYGAQIANDLVGNYVELDHRQLIVVAKVGMLILTLLLVPSDKRARGGFRGAAPRPSAPDQQMPAIPRTLSGKKLEIPVKRILAGEPAHQVETGRADDIAEQLVGEVPDQRAQFAQAARGERQRHQPSQRHR